MKINSRREILSLVFGILFIFCFSIHERAHAKQGQEKLTRIAIKFEDARMLVGMSDLGCFLYFFDGTTLWVYSSGNLKAGILSLVQLQLISANEAARLLTPGALLEPWVQSYVDCGDKGFWEEDTQTLPESSFESFQNFLIGCGWSEITLIPIGPPGPLPPPNGGGFPTASPYTWPGCCLGDGSLPLIQFCAGYCEPTASGLTIPAFGSASEEADPPEGGTPFVPNPECSDGNPCTIDYKNAEGECIHVPKDCSDNNPCTEDFCDPETGDCIHIPIPGCQPVAPGCDDGNPCTIDYMNAQEECVHVPKNCSDNNPCTYDYCDPETGNCIHIPIPDCQETPPPPPPPPCTPGCSLQLISSFPSPLCSGLDDQQNLQASFKLSNTADGEDCPKTFFTVKVSSSGPPNIVGLPQFFTFSLDAGQSVTSTVTLIKQANSPGGEELVTFEVIDGGSCSANAVIQVGEAKCSATLDSAMICPGNSKPLSLLITNPDLYCTAQYSFGITQSGLPNVSLSYNAAGSDDIFIPPGESQTVEINAVVAANSPSGIENIEVQLLAKFGGTQKVCSVNAAVTVPSKEISGVINLPSDPVVLFAGSKQDLPFTIGNEGLCDASLTWRLKRPPSEVKITPAEISGQLSLEPGEGVALQATLNVDSDSPEGFVIYELSALEESGWQTLDTITIQVVPVDLDIDSDNNNGFSLPDRSDHEEAIEDDPNEAGKLLFANEGDIDQDGVPDFADGIEIYGNGGTDASERFIPIVISVPPEIDPFQLEFRLIYSDSDPAQIVKGEDVYGDVTYERAPGALRVWTKDGNLSRSPYPLSGGGDFVKSGTKNPLAGLAQNGQIILYVEAVRAGQVFGDQSIKLQFIQSGNAVDSSDTIRISSIRKFRIAYRQDYNDWVQFVGLPLKAVYTDDLDASGNSYEGTLSDDGTQLFVGQDQPNPYSANDPLKDQQYFKVRVSTDHGNSFLPLNCGPVLLTMDADGLTAYNNEGPPTSSGLISELVKKNAPPSDTPVGEDWVDPNPSDIDPDGFEADFELELSENFDDAYPSIDWLESEAWQLRGLMYGGRSYEFFHWRDVWRSGNLIYVEDSLSPKEAAQAYYNYLLAEFGPNVHGITLTPVLRYVGEIYTLLGEDRAQVGEYCAKNWGLIDTAISNYEGEIYGIATGFALGGLYEIRQTLKNAERVRFSPPDCPPGMKKYAVPTIRRNNFRGNYVELDTITTSLGQRRNMGAGKFKIAANGTYVATIPDALIGNSIVEIKDWARLSKVKQLVAQANWAKLNGRNYVLICTTRTKKISAPLLEMMTETGPGISRALLRRSVNADTYQKWIRTATGGKWVDLTKEQVLAILHH